jgi:hypothetical protein
MPKPNVCVRDTKVRKNLGFATCFFRKMEGVLFVIWNYTFDTNMYKPMVR